MRRELDEIKSKFEQAEVAQYEKDMEAEEQEKYNKLMNNLAGANNIRGVGKKTNSQQLDEELQKSPGMNFGKTPEEIAAEREAKIQKNKKITGRTAENKAEEKEK